MDILNAGAEFSEDRMYRYALWRIWDRDTPLIAFIGLNPSTANETDDDPTIRRVVSFSKKWGYGGVYMVNLFAYVTSDPAQLSQCEDPLGDNDFWLDHVARICLKVVFAWGSFPQAADRAREVIQKFDGYALVVNKDGSPRHPLYVLASTELIQYNQAK